MLVAWARRLALGLRTAVTSLWDSISQETNNPYYGSLVGTGAGQEGSKLRVVGRAPGIFKVK